MIRRVALFAATGPGPRDLLTGVVGPIKAVEQGVVTIRAGELGPLDRFTELFRIEP